MHVISRDNPALYLTAVTKDRLPVFRTDTMKDLSCEALNEARNSGGFSIYAYVIMPDHLHLITDGFSKPSKILRFINGITSRRVIDYLKDHGHNSSLQKLRHEDKERGYRYSLWDHHNNVFSITSEQVLIEKANYIHQNPVRAGLIERAQDYRWSSVRIWQGCPLENEPLMVDTDQISWRRG
ncbi:MAG TPA: transposase [Pyrinomonadaceae bacterium]|nr:transposase [Pyrinomonadaceae bacterium]